jgi:KipI family sensor histidine kinase inhibitor
VTADDRAVVVCGDTAVVARVEGPVEACHLAAALRADPPAELVEVVPGIRTVLVVVGHGVDLHALAAAVASVEASADPPEPARTHDVVLALDGPDLKAVARHAGLERDGLAAALEAAPLQVAMVGFSPGFAYLAGLPENLASVPRRASPRAAVRAGSFALAGGFCAFYPQATPGGWQVVGHSAESFFDAEVAPFARFAPGDRVRLTVGRTAHGAAPSARTVARPPWRATDTPAVFAVEDPGLLTLVQDAGRRAVANLGVPAGGPADPYHHELANRLVGNPPGAPALEVAGRGPVLVCRRPAHVAVVGAKGVSIDTRPVDAGRVVPLDVDQRLSVGAPEGGMRAYVAIAGGVLAPPVLGSRATDVLAWLGPGPLVAGDELCAVEAPGVLRAHLDPSVLDRSARPGPPWRLRVLRGPDPGWFGPTALAQLCATRFVVDATSSRVGVRLRSSGAALQRRGGELDPAGVVTGAVQIPPDGRPVVLGCDHATTGGYPVLAVVIAADRWILGQCAPGDEVEFESVSYDEALGATALRREVVALACVGHYPVVAG